MKKIGIAVFVSILYGCSCLAQIPPVTTYVDENCQAVVPDFTLLVTVSDNCNIVNLFQNPAAGTIVGTGITDVRITAVDESGNESSVSTEIIALDTIPPIIEINQEAFLYPDEDVYEMYRVFNCWIQNNKDMFLRQFTEFDTINFVWFGEDLENTIFNHTINIPDYNDTYNCFLSLF